MGPIFSYLDFREYLREKLQDLKTSRWYSERAFANRAGFSSPSYVKMVLDGKRNLSAEGALKIAKALNLKKSETKFFQILVQFTQSKKSEERTAHLKTIMEFKKFLEIRPLEPYQFEYFSNWRIVALREALTSSFWQKQTPQVLAEALDWKEPDVLEALNLLLKLDLIKAAPGGGYKATDRPVQTPKEMQSLVVRNYHRQMLELATSSLDSVAITERDVGALTIPLSEESYLEVKEKVAALRREINAKYSNQAEARSIYQLNFQLFPLLKEPS